MNLQPPPLATVLTDARNLPTAPWSLWFSGLTKKRSGSGLLAKLPDFLRKEDAGYIYEATDYARRFRWTGTAWEYAPGERQEQEIAILPVAPASGWHLCDGATVAVTRPDGTTHNVALPNIVGSYPKGASSLGSVIANVNPTITATATSAGTPTGTVSLSSGSTINGGAGAPQSVVDSASFSGNPLPTHTHTVTVTVPGEPQHIGIPYYTKL